MARRMENLRETLVHALLDDEYLWTPDFDATRGDAERITTTVLRALGLDDLDAAVERMAEIVGVETYNREGDLEVARAALEAALTAAEVTNETQTEPGNPQP